MEPRALMHASQTLSLWPLSPVRKHFDLLITFGKFGFFLIIKVTRSDTWKILNAHMWWCLCELTRLRIFIWSINILCTQLLHRYPHPQRSFSFKKNSIKWWKEAYLYIKASLQVGIKNEILSFPSSSKLWAHQEIWGQRIITCASFLTRSCNLCLSGQHPYCNNWE